jgi:hypothetical protein
MGNPARAVDKRFFAKTFHPPLRQAGRLSGPIGGAGGTWATIGVRGDDSLRPEQTLDVWPHLRLGGRRRYRELGREALCCPHCLGRGNCSA